MTQPPTEHPSREERIDEAIAAYLRAAEAGQAPAPEPWLAQHADLADELRSFLADRAEFRRLAAAVPAAPSAGNAPEPPTLAPDVNGGEQAHILAGPDLDGDGCRDVLTAALLREPFDSPDARGLVRLILMVAAVSGADGRILWRTLRPVAGSESHSFGPRLGPLLEWPAGPGGRSRVMVTYANWQKKESGDFHYDEKDEVNQCFVFSAADGKLQQTFHAWFRTGTADLNGDGLLDLYGLHRDEAGGSGKLYAISGGPPDAVSVQIRQGGSEEGPEGDLPGPNRL